MRKNYKDVYNLPFKMEKGLTWAYDDNDNFIFQFENPEHKPLVLEILNGHQNQRLEVFTLTVSNKNPNPNKILNKGKPFIIIRGWGNLTGARHNLEPEQAKDIQDDLRDWIICKLTNE